MSDAARVAVVAARLGLRPPRDPHSEPWRHALLLYLAALIDVADFEGTHFGHAEALTALQTLRDDLADAIMVLERRQRRRA